MILSLKPIGPRNDEDIISLLRRLAALYPDETSCTPGDVAEHGDS